MKDLIKHVKQVAIDDVHLFFRPFVNVIRAIRRWTWSGSIKIKRFVRRRSKSRDR